jgi:hypothetical protein
VVEGGAGYAEILQADAYAGFGDLYDTKHKPGPITEAACWSHSRRKFFELAELGKSRLSAHRTISRSSGGQRPRPSEKAWLTGRSARR